MIISAAAITAIAAVAGAGVSGYGAYKQMKGAKDASAASARAEAARMKQLKLQTQMEQRKAFRDFAAKRSLAVANLARSNAMQGSAYGGAMGQTVGDLGRNQANISDSYNIGMDIFAANADLSRAQGNIATGEALGRFGNILFSNAKTIGDVGTSAFGGNSGPGGYGGNSRGYSPYDRGSGWSP